MKPELENVILVQDLCMVMENFGIEEDIDDLTDLESETDRKKSNSQTLENEASGAIDMNELNKKLEKDNRNVVSTENKKDKPVESKVEVNKERVESKKQNTYNKRDSDSDNPYDVEPDKPKGAFDYKKNANAAKVESDEEDNEDLFEAPSQEIKGGSKNIKEKQDEIKDEYDFDIPGNII